MKRRAFLMGSSSVLVAPAAVLAQQEHEWWRGHHHRHEQHPHHQQSHQNTATPGQAGQAPTATPAQAARAPTATPEQAAHAPTATAGQAAQAPTATAAQAAQAPTATAAQAAEAPTATAGQAAEAPTATAGQAAQAPTASQSQAAQSPAAQQSQQQKTTTTQTAQPAETTTATPTYVATLPNPSGGDDTNAINAALASAGGGYVHAPGPNTWLHSGIINIPAGVILRGDGDSSVFLATDTQQDPNQAMVLAGTGAGLAYCKLMGNFPTGLGLSPGDSTGGGNRSSQPYSHMVLIVSSCRSFLLDHVHTIGGASGGIYCSGASGGQVQYCTVEYALADGIGLYSGTSNTVVQNCTVSGCGDDGISIVPYAGGPQGSGIVIQSNNVSNGYWGRGITDVGSNGALIQGNTVSNYYASGLLADQDPAAGTTAPTNGTWSGNTVLGTPNRASGYTAEFFVYRNASGYTVINNHANTIPGGCAACAIDPSSRVATYSGNSWQ